MTSRVEADYLIVGAGAMGMAFADVLHTETDATMAIVDRHARPGGHWNDSYPFVRLHQPSSFYGVNSRALGSDTIDQVGWNSGLYELASGTEVVTYFEQVMQQQLQPSGRVEFLPMSEYVGEGRVVGRVSGEEVEVVAGKVVDATYMNVRVPSQTAAPFAVAESVRCVPLNALPDEAATSEYVIVGAGKTAMDAVLWLLAQGLDPDAIMWITPRDSWIIDRANIQPGEEFFGRSLGVFAAQVQASAEAATIDDLFGRLERDGVVLRLDPDVRPTMYRCATCTQAEVEQLRRVRRVVRLGRVRSVTLGRMELEEGALDISPDALVVHCAADGLEHRPVKPVFDGDLITLQTVRHCQQVFSAAFIGHLEAAYDDPVVKNELATVVPHPNTHIDWLRTALANTLNAARWRQDADLTEWLQNARLDGFSRTRSSQGETAAEREALGAMTRHAAASVTNLERLIAEAEAAALG